MLVEHEGSPVYEAMLQNKGGSTQSPAVWQSTESPSSKQGMCSTTSMLKPADTKPGAIMAMPLIFPYTKCKNWDPATPMLRATANV